MFSLGIFFNLSSSAYGLYQVLNPQFDVKNPKPQPGQFLNLKFIETHHIECLISETESEITSLCRFFFC